MHDRWHFNKIGLTDDLDHARWLFDNDHVRLCLDDGFGWWWNKVKRGLPDNRFGAIGGKRQALSRRRAPNRRRQLVYAVRVKGAAHLPASRGLDAGSVQRAQGVYAVVFDQAKIQGDSLGKGSLAARGILAARGDEGR